MNFWRNLFGQSTPTTPHPGTATPSHRMNQSTEKPSELPDIASDSRTALIRQRYAEQVRQSDFSLNYYTFEEKPTFCFSQLRDALLFSLSIIPDLAGETGDMCWSCGSRATGSAHFDPFEITLEPLFRYTTFQVGHTLAMNQQLVWNFPACNAHQGLGPQLDFSYLSPTPNGNPDMFFVTLRFLSGHPTSPTHATATLARMKSKHSEHSCPLFFLYPARL